MSAKIDIILPTYNRREFLPRAIRCVLRQTFPDWRLLVVNDGGEDVADIVRAAADPRVVLFDRPHAGKAAQLNFALGQASAEYVAYMDDDDDVFPEHLEKLLSAAERTGADFVYSDTYRTILDAHGRIVDRTVENTEDATPDNIRLYNRINHKQILHRRELAERVGGYDESMRILIDFDGIKRLLGAARRPFHLREVTGEHFLRMDAATGRVSSISGLWEKDPAAAGRSLLTFFGKDPAALASLYRTVPKLEAELGRLRDKRNRSWRIRLRNLFCRGKGQDRFEDALPPKVAWRAVAADGLRSFFAFADETDASVAAVNRIASGDRSKAALAQSCDGRRFPPEVRSPDFRVEDVAGGCRFRSAAGRPYRWVMLTSRTGLADDFAIEFDYVPHTRFREQLQIDFRMASLGDRLRFMVRDNEVLCANAVDGGRFLPDGRRVPLTLPLDAVSHVRIESCGGVHSFFVGERNVLSLRFRGAAGNRGRFAALVFYDPDPTVAIDFEIRNFRYLAVE